MTDTKYYINNGQGELTMILPLDQICEMLQLKFNRQAEQIDFLKNKIKYLTDENWKDETMQKMKAEHEKAQAELRIGFPISAEEMNAINNWKKEHEKEKHAYNNSLHFPRRGAIGGGYNYIFTPTSIGTFGKIVCSCGDEFMFQEER